MEHAIATRAAENRALRKEKAALEQMRRWQVGTIATSVLLILLLGYVVMVQLKRGRRLRRLADFDALTHVASRASILAAGESAVTQAQAEGMPMCVLMFDIDHFKAVNDTHGHPSATTCWRKSPRPAAGHCGPRTCWGAPAARSSW